VKALSIIQPNIKIKKRKKKIYHNDAFKNDMTYILGARCRDGVVLVGDTKVTVGGGTDFQYAKKIVFPLGNVVMCSAGASGLYKTFQDRIITAIIQMEREDAEYAYQNDMRRIPSIISDEEFYTLVSRVIRQMHIEFNEDRYMIAYNLMILCASRIGKPDAQLIAFTGEGIPEPVNNYMVIGHGEPYGSIFLKKLWKKNMTMQQTAKLGVFILKYIQDMHLDSSVCFNNEYLPQVVFIPNIRLPNDFPVKSAFDCDEEEYDEIRVKYAQLQDQYPINELSEDDVRDIINQVGSKVADFNHFLTNGQFKL